MNTELEITPDQLKEILLVLSNSGCKITPVHPQKSIKRGFDPGTTEIKDEITFYGTKGMFTQKIGVLTGSMTKKDLHMRESDGYSQAVMNRARGSLKATLFLPSLDQLHVRTAASYVLR